MAKQVISFHYTLTDEAGEIIDSSRDAQPMAFLEGAGQIIPGLEEVLTTLKTGDKKKVKVFAQNAYGAFDDKLIYKVERSKFPLGEIKVGSVFRVGQEGGYQVVTVIEVDTAMVTLDANHPLAGKDLNFDIEITDRRDAIADEITHSHAHGAGGHAH